MNLPPRPNREQPVPALKSNAVAYAVAHATDNAESMQSESDLRAQGLPPKRQFPSPSAHGQTKVASGGLTPQDKTLVRWELFSQPSLTLPLNVPGNPALANKAWDWASSLGGDSPRWKRFLRVVRIRALGYRRAGARGDVAIKAQADVALAIGAVSPRKDGSK